MSSFDLFILSCLAIVTIGLNNIFACVGPLKCGGPCLAKHVEHVEHAYLPLNLMTAVSMQLPPSASPATV